MSSIIVTTPDELRQIIKHEIESYFERASALENVVETEADLFTIDDATAFLKNAGFPTSKGTLYRLTSQNKIPHKKYGNKLVFNKAALIEWVAKKQ